jgi:hypothetical protein
LLLLLRVALRCVALLLLPLLPLLTNNASRLFSPVLLCRPYCPLTSRLSRYQEALAEYFQKCIVAEAEYFEYLKNAAFDAAVDWMEANPDGADVRVPAEDGAEDDVSAYDAAAEDYEALLANRDAMMDVINSSHEQHEAIVLKADEATRREAKAQMEQRIVGHKATEWKRARDRVLDLDAVKGDLLQALGGEQEGEEWQGE